jgi:diadenosine tetraphosphate (Ap4A) HIT family hydrolase
MKYKTFLKTMKDCPFCLKSKPKVLLENDTAYLTYSLAPYHKYHLLVIPKKHVESIKELTVKENTDTMKLITSGIRSLSKIGHNDCTIVMRDGQSLGKSVQHVHYNIIPGGQIEDISINSEVRKLLNKEEETSLIKDLQKIF